MTSRRKPPIIRTAPEGIEASWEIENGHLVVYLDAGLDEVARQRYIAEAMAWHAIEPRRRGLLPLPLVGGIDTARETIRSHRAATAAAAVSVLTAGGIALAVAHDDFHTRSHPPGAAPAPRQPAPPSAVPKKPVPRPTAPSKTRPSHTPTARPSPAATTSLEPDVTAIASHLTPRLPLPSSLPIAVPPPLGGGHSIRPTVLPVPTRAPERVCVLRVHVGDARTVAVKLRICVPA